MYKMFVTERLIGVVMASTMARGGRKVTLVCPRELEPVMRERVLEWNGGAWPIGLKVEAI